MQIDTLDHLVLTVRDLEVTCQFYTRALGMTVVTFGQGRTALTFGSQKINLHRYTQEFEPKARRPMPGSADLCFITSIPLTEVMVHLKALDIEILFGPVERTGAMGPILSIYCRDPDQNLIEIANYRNSQ